MVNDEDSLNYPTDATQIRALDIYCSSAKEENDFKPLSYVKISEQLLKEGFENCSKTQVGRWGKLFNFKAHLDKKIELAYISNSSKEIQRKVTNKSTQDIADRLKINGEITDDLYTIVRCFIDDTKEDLIKGLRIDKDRMKIVKDLLVLTTTREDKLLDRLAGQGGDKLSSGDLLAHLEKIEIQIESDDVIDVELDDE